MFESIIRPSQPKREQDDPKEAHQDLKETKKTAVPKTLKKTVDFLDIFEYRHLSRRHPGHQRVTKKTQEIPKHNRMISKIESKKTIHFYQNFGTHFSTH